ncbi:hypothetical protein GCM10028805_63500 [Spirosoma harenae]
MGHPLRFFALFLFLLVYYRVQAQLIDSVATGCGIPGLTAAQRKVLEQKTSFALRRKMASNAAFAAITYVPIRPHILRKSDGTGGMSIANINQVIAVTNSYYLQNGFGIQFYFAGTTPDYVDNDEQYSSFSDEEAVTQGHDVTNALNQYYVNAFAISGLGGYAYYPADSLYSTRSFILNEYWNLDDLGNRLIPHELGHTFNLIHTFGDNNGDGTSTELVTHGEGANCTTDGDLVCDTPADPYGIPGARLIRDNNNCPSYDPTSTARDARNEAYSPSISNIMSYYFPCTHDFTPGQYDRIQAGLALRQSHTAYTLNYPPTIVAAPTNLTASMNNGTVVLAWQDNANNEMGYFVERSTSPNTGFLPIGGVGPNQTTFADPKTVSFKTYYYRIRPSNATTVGLSQVVSIHTPPCRPSYTYACLYPVGLSSVSLNNKLLSQNSGCSSGGYGTLSGSTTVQPGLSYPISATFLYASYYQGVSVWADLNRDGQYDANLGEKLFQTPVTVLRQFSGTITIPANLTSGELSIRIMTIYGGTPTDPCGSYSYGEAEDYLLNVVTPADLSLALQTNTRISELNQPVSYSLTIHNAGPFKATGVQWINRLPTGLSFFNGDADIAGSATAVMGINSSSLAIGESRTFTYQLKPTLPGTFINSAQLVTSDQLDSDSQPNSGTGDGQDDQASVDIRTTLAGESVYTSPNPNQTPLPPVLSNQPVPDPAKADLSLMMQVDHRILNLNQQITIRILISNRGGASASAIVIRDTLRGLRFVSSPTNMSVVSSGVDYVILEGTVNSLAMNESATLIVIATPSSTGELINVAQIWSSGTADSDSRPGSLTPTANNLNGEDDVAQIAFKVIDN